jgi:hypothetical protein
MATVRSTGITGALHFAPHARAEERLDLVTAPTQTTESVPPQVYSLVVSFAALSRIAVGGRSQKQSSSGVDLPRPCLAVRRNF